MTFRTYISILFGISISASSLLFGQEEQRSSFPKIVAHSDTNITVYQGDKLELKAEVAGNAFSATWIRQRRVVCKDVICKIDTKNWKYGIHKLVFVAYNNFGSRSVNYTVRVYSSQTGREVETLKPELVAYQGEDNEQRAEGLSAQTLRGISYAYSSDKIQVLAAAPRTLSWNESLKTEAKSVLVFGRPFIDEQFLVDKSKVQLSIPDPGLRQTQLLRGSLRVRQIRQENPSVRVKVGKSVEIDGDNLSDYIVKVKSPKSKFFEIQVLRGNVRVFDPTALTKVKYIPQGVRVRLKEGTQKEAVYAPLNARSGVMQRLTTPHYMFAKEKQKNSERIRQPNLLSKSSDRSVEDAVRAAVSLLVNNDPISALEVLNSHFDSDSDAVQIKLAQAFFEVGAYSSSAKFLEKLAAKNKKDMQWQLINARLGTLRSRFEELYDELSDFDISGEREGEGELLYLRGVSAYRLGLEGSAFNDFSRCYELCTDESRKASSKEFTSVLREDKWFRVFGKMGGHYRSNIFRLQDSPSHFKGYANKASGYYSAIGVWARFLNSRNFFGAFSFDLQRNDYFDKLLKDFEPVHQEFRFDLVGKWGGFAHKPAVAIGLSPFLKMQYFANERLADRIGADAYITVPMVWGAPKLYLRSETLTDPLPNRDDILDPVTMTIVSASDRSSSISRYGLSLEWLSFETFKMQSSIESGTRSFKKNTSKAGEYEETYFDINAVIGKKRDSVFNLNIAVTNRKFASSTPKNESLEYRFSGEWQKYLHSFLFLETGFEVIKMNSNIKDSRHESSAMNVGVGVEI